VNLSIDSVNQTDAGRCHSDTHITVTPALVMRDKEFWGCDLQVENVS